ncbi:Glucose-6-phosphate 1-dehydrogenase [Crocosphaera watsonii WH 0401]|nr:Glucose-6-phosphate 1-dehydrogenase [Crocosphaera watsonii WH 0401]
MQLFCLTAMEPPNALNADSIRNEKLRYYKQPISLTFITWKNLLFGDNIKQDG